MALVGLHTNFPLHGASKKQTATSFSTPEAEMVSGCFGYRTVLIPALDLWEPLMPALARPRFHEDNQAIECPVETQLCDTLGGCMVFRFSG